MRCCEESLVDVLGLKSGFPGRVRRKRGAKALRLVVSILLLGAEGMNCPAVVLAAVTVVMYCVSADVDFQFIGEGDNSLDRDGKETYYVSVA